MTPTLARYIDVSGTWSVRDGKVDDWNALDSPFSKFRADHGLLPWVDDPLRLFEWSTDLDGLPGDGGHADWRATGRSLANYAINPLTGRPNIPPDGLNLFTHSHGCQPVIYACAEFDLKVNVLIDVAGPVRGDMLDLAAKAKKNIKLWLHLYAGFEDRWQIAGELFSGGTFRRKQPHATVNAKIPGGHGTILRDPAYFHYWIDQGWLAWLTPAVGV
jgi:hypothetical protein